MTTPRTLLSMAGADMAPGRLSESTVVLVDCQNEYVSGALPLTGVQAALDEIAVLLERARTIATPVVHVVHQGRAGSLFDLDAPNGREVDAVQAVDGEPVVRKTLPNSFAGTDLHERLTAIGRKNLIVVGFQTHMCISATVRSALDHGYRITVPASCAATRDLPSPTGGVVTAQILHDATLAALADRFAIVVPTQADVPD